MDRKMAPTFCTLTPPSRTSIPQFIKDQPYLSLLETQCNSMRDLKKLHAHLIKTGLAKDNIASSRVIAFSITHDLNYAHQVFAKIPKPNLFTWNTIIRGFSDSSDPGFAISLYVEMLGRSSVEPQRLTYPSIFKAYSQLCCAHEGAQLHGRVIKQGLQIDSFVKNTMINMYANCGYLSEAYKLFDEDDEFDVVSWNSMIMALAKSGEIDDAKKLFDKMPKRNTISWNSMISGCVRNGKWVEALELFSRMQSKNVKPSEFTMVSLLNASARLGALKQGEWVHEYVTKNGFEMNVIVATAIIDMYAKCGSIDKALEVFEAAPVKGLASWNSIILGLATNGREEEALQLFSRLELSESKPDSVSFIGVLSACNHSGLVDKAKEYFTSMNQTYGIEPSMKHYGCLVDLLGRMGLIEEAEEVVKRMPMNPDSIILGSLLSACWKHGKAEIGQRVAKALNELNPSESSGYVLMSNVYAASGHFEEATQERVAMRKNEIEKQPGCSSIEVDGEVYEFVAGGTLHPHIQELYIV